MLWSIIMSWTVDIGKKQAGRLLLWSGTVAAMAVSIGISVLGYQGIQDTRKAGLSKLD